MKKIILTLLFVVGITTTQAQVVRTTYDSLQDKKMLLMQEHLVKCNKQFYTGAGLWYIGLLVTAMSTQNVEENKGMLYAGLGLNTLGSIIMIASHKQIGLAGRTRTLKPLTEYK